MSKWALIAIAAGGSASAGAADTFLTGLPRVIVPAIVCGLLGGACAAAMPWGETSWSGKTAIKLVFVGFAVGLGTGFFLAHPWFAWVGDYPKMGVETVAGFLGFQILELLRTIGPKGVAAWLLRRPLPPKETSP